MQLHLNMDAARRQVLSNPELRQRYDQHGAEGISDVNLADSAEFFGALFGSTQFDHLVRRPPRTCRWLDQLCQSFCPANKTASTTPWSCFIVERQAHRPAADWPWHCAQMVSSFMYDCVRGSTIERPLISTRVFLCCKRVPCLSPCTRLSSIAPTGGRAVHRVDREERRRAPLGAGEGSAEGARGRACGAAHRAAQALRVRRRGGLPGGQPNPESQP